MDAVPLRDGDVAAVDLQRLHCLGLDIGGEEAFADVRLQPLIGHQSRHQPGAVRLHHLGRLVVEIGAVLDRIDPGGSGRLNPAGAVGMGHRLQPDAVRGGDDRLHLGVAEMLFEADRAVVEDPAGGHELDHVDTLGRRVPDDDSARLRRIADAVVLVRGVDRCGEFGGEADRIVGVPAGNR